MEQVKEITTVLNPEVVIYDDDTIIAMAENAEKQIKALKIIMNASLQVTSDLDWTIIGGKPYLQSSGAEKIARLHGVSWEIMSCENSLDEGYPSCKYTIRFKYKGLTIEAIGARSGKDEFFAGKNRTKKPDEIDPNDVEKAAFTNCMGRGIKALIPGLQNISLKTLEDAGIKAASGYTFKTGSKGGATNSNLTCEACGAMISQKVASFSEGKFGKRLCMQCQNGNRPEDDEIPLPPEPPMR